MRESGRNLANSEIRGCCLRDSFGGRTPSAMPGVPRIGAIGIVAVVSSREHMVVST
jgi:hypothetical protein